MAYRWYYIVITIVSLLTLIFFTDMVRKVPFHRPRVLERITPTSTTFRHNGKDNELTNEQMKALFVSENLKTSSQPKSHYCNKAFQSKHYMTITYPIGRLGNNVFQLLTLLGTAIDHCYTPVLTEVFLHYNDLDAVFDTSLIKHISKHPEQWKVYPDPLGTKYTSKIRDLEHNTNWSLTGYFQSWRYFDTHKHVIQSVLKYKKHVSDSILKYFNSVPGLREKTKICVHLRRGDLLRADHQRAGFASAGIDFLNRSMEYFMNKLNDTSVVFIYISDEIEWCKKHIKHRNVYFSPFSSSKTSDAAGKDLAMMSYCDHSIVTSGSFGWIGAWFGSGHVVYFKGFPKPGSSMDRRLSRSDYYPPHWTGIM